MRDRIKDCGQLSSVVEVQSLVFQRQELKAAQRFKIKSPPIYGSLANSSKYRYMPVRLGKFEEYLARKGLPIKRENLGLMMNSVETSTKNRLIFFQLDSCGRENIQFLLPLTRPRWSWLAAVEHHLVNDWRVCVRACVFYSRRAQQMCASMNEHHGTSWEEEEKGGVLMIR